MAAMHEEEVPEPLECGKLLSAQPWVIRNPHIKNAPPPMTACPGACSQLRCCGRPAHLQPLPLRLVLRAQVPEGRARR